MDRGPVRRSQRLKNQPRNHHPKHPDFVDITTQGIRDYQRGKVSPKAETESRVGSREFGPRVEVRDDMDKSKEETNKLAEEFWKEALGDNLEWEAKSESDQEPEEFKEAMTRSDEAEAISPEEIKQILEKSEANNVPPQEHTGVNLLEEQMMLPTDAPVYNFDINLIRSHQKQDFEDKYKEAWNCKSDTEDQEHAGIGITPDGYYLNKDFLLHKIMFCEKENKNKSLIVLPEIWEERIIEDMHQRFHEGTSCLVHRLMDRGWYCKSLTDTARKARKTCVKCTLYDLQPYHTAAPFRRQLSTVDALQHTQCGQSVSIDGLHLDKSDGQTELLIGVCNNCNLCTASLIRNTTDEDFLKFLRKIFRELGYFHAITCDSTGYQASAKVIEAMKQFNKGVAEVNFNLLKSNGINLLQAMEVMEDNLQTKGAENKQRPIARSDLEESQWEEESNPKTVKSLLNYIFNRAQNLPRLHRLLIMSPITPSNSQGNPAERRIKAILRKLLLENQAEGNIGKLGEKIDEILDKHNSQPQPHFEGLTPYEIHRAENKPRTAGQQVEDGGFYPNRTIKIPLRKVMKKNRAKLHIEGIINKHHQKHAINSNDCKDENPYSIQPGDIVFKRIQGQNPAPKFRRHYAVGPYFVLGKRTLKKICVEVFLLNCTTNRFVRTSQKNLFPLFLVDYLIQMSPASRRLHFDQLPGFHNKVKEKFITKRDDEWVSQGLAQTLTGTKARISYLCLEAASILTGLTQASLEDHETIERFMWLDATTWTQIGLGQILEKESERGRKKDDEKVIEEDDDENYNEDEVIEGRKVRFNLNDSDLKSDEPNED